MAVEWDQRPPFAPIHEEKEEPVEHVLTAHTHAADAEQEGSHWSARYRVKPEQTQDSVRMVFLLFLLAGCLSAAHATTPITDSNIQTAVDLWTSDSNAAETEYGHISNWNTSLVTDMTELFKDKSTFNDDISGWVTSSVTTMHKMFYEASSFNQDISAWDTSSVTTMSAMFYDATSFNQRLCWDLSDVSDTSDMFSGSSGSIGGCPPTPNKQESALSTVELVAIVVAGTVVAGLGLGAATHYGIFTKVMAKFGAKSAGRGTVPPAPAPQSLQMTASGAGMQV